MRLYTIAMQLQPVKFGTPEYKARVDRITEEVRPPKSSGSTMKTLLSTLIREPSVMHFLIRLQAFKDTRPQPEGAPRRRQERSYFFKAKFFDRKQWNNRLGHKAGVRTDSSASDYSTDLFATPSLQLFTHTSIDILNVMGGIGSLRKFKPMAEVSAILIQTAQAFKMLTLYQMRQRSDPNTQMSQAEIALLDPTTGEIDDSILGPFYELEREFRVSIAEPDYSIWADEALQVLDTTTASMLEPHLSILGTLSPKLPSVLAKYADSAIAVISDKLTPSGLTPVAMEAHREATLARFMFAYNRTRFAMANEPMDMLRWPLMCEQTMKMIDDELSTYGCGWARVRQHALLSNC